MCMHAHGCVGVYVLVVVCMCVWVCIHMGVRAHGCTCMHASLCMGLRACVWVHAWMRGCLRACACACLRMRAVRACVRAHACVCMRAVPRRAAPCRAHGRVRTYVRVRRVHTHTYRAHGGLHVYIHVHMHTYTILSRRVAAQRSHLRAHAAVRVYADGTVQSCSDAPAQSWHCARGSEVVAPRRLYTRRSECYDTGIMMLL